MFKHGIRGDRQRIPNGMPDSTDQLYLEFFANLGCPLAPTADEAKEVEVHPVEMVKDSVKGVKPRKNLIFLKMAKTIKLSKWFREACKFF